MQVGHCEQWVAQSGCEYPVFNVAGVPTGIMICRDKLYPGIARILTIEGAQLLLTLHDTIDTEAQRFVDWSLRICTVRAIGKRLLSDREQ